MRSERKKKTGESKKTKCRMKNVEEKTVGEEENDRSESDTGIHPAAIDSKSLLVHALRPSGTRQNRELPSS
jgi:hypothetical protein